MKVWNRPAPTADRWAKVKDVAHGHVKHYREKMRDVRAVFFDGTPDAIAAVKEITKHTPEVTAVTAEAIEYSGMVYEVPCVVVIGQMGFISMWTETDFTSVFEPAPGP